MWKKQALSPQALNPQASGLRGLDFVRAAPPPSQALPELLVHTHVTFFALFFDVIFGTHFLSILGPRPSQNDPKIDPRWLQNPLRARLRETCLRIRRFCYFFADF